MAPSSGAVDREPAERLERVYRNLRAALETWHAAGGERGPWLACRRLEVALLLADDCTVEQAGGWA